MDVYITILCFLPAFPFRSASLRRQFFDLLRLLRKIKPATYTHKVKIQTELENTTSTCKKELHSASLCQARGWGGHPIAHSVPGYYGQRVTRNSSIGK